MTGLPERLDMGKISLPIRDKDTAYVDTWLWLPKRHIPVDTLKGTFTIISQNSYTGNDKTVVLWRDAPNHLGVPRAKVNPAKLPYPVVDLRPRTYRRIGARSSLILDELYPEKDVQRQAYRKLQQSSGGILNLSCGAGKSPVLLHAAAYWDRPMLIINDKPHILDQWRGEIERFLRFDGGVGWVQGDPSTWKWEHPITLATLKTLAMHRDAVSLEMIRHFGVIIWDEIHRLASTEYCRTADIFLGNRYGATATVERPDGLQMVYLWHVGRPVYTNLEQEVTPKVVFLRSPTELNIYSADCCDISGNVHLGKLRIAVAKQESEIRFVHKLVREAVDRDREALILSFSKDQIIALHEEFDSGVLHAGITHKSRLSQLENNKIVFATNDLAKEALNKKDLDSLVFLNEVTSSITLTQAPGRIQRCNTDGTKKNAKVVVLWHVNVEPLYKMGFKMKRHFKEQGMEVTVV